MRRAAALAVAGTCLVLLGCRREASSLPAAAGNAPIRIQIDLQHPARSRALVITGNRTSSFKVGYGRHGVTCAGTRFEEGYTPLGRFRVNAILSASRFEMEPGLVSQSGKSAAELKAELFRNMSAIDFDGDGQTGEYGIGYISLSPLNSVPQPFRFNTYNGRFRWYSFAIHGSNNDQRIGQKVTGGCVNVAEPALKTLLTSVKLGEEVVISANGPCTP